MTDAITQAIQALEKLIPGAEAMGWSTEQARAALAALRQQAGNPDVTHKQGCEALGGYGHGVGPCTCGAVERQQADSEQERDAKRYRWLRRDLATSAVPLEIGRRIKDNDPRMGTRILTITDIGGAYVQAVYAARKHRIRRDRIYTDGKPRRSGFSLLPAREVA